MKGDLSVAIVGAGKVGTALARALRQAGCSAVLRSARRGLPKAAFASDLLILAIRETGLEALARQLADRRLVGRRTAVVHCAGSLGPEPLFALRGIARGVAQMHPMISFASRTIAPSLTGGYVHLDGDPAAVRVAERVVRRLGMTPWSLPELDRVGYHAAAGLLANGAAALAGAACELLEKSGVSRKPAARMLGALLGSVADNVARLGLPEALTGPVRRGDARAVARHLEVIGRRAPRFTLLFKALVAAQIPLARGLGEGDAAAWDAMTKLVGE